MAMRPNRKRKKSQALWACPFNRLPFVAGVILGSLFLAYLFLNENGLPLYFQMVQKEEELKGQTHHLEESNVELSEAINRIQDDPSELEQLARERLGMVRDGEVVYQFVEPKTDKSAAIP